MISSHEKMFNLAGFDSDSLSSDLIDCLWHDAQQTKQCLMVNIGFLIPGSNDELLEIMLTTFSPLFALIGHKLNYSEDLKKKIQYVPVTKKQFYEDEVFFIIASIPMSLLNIH